MWFEVIRESLKSYLRLFRSSSGTMCNVWASLVFIRGLCGDHSGSIGNPSGMQYYLDHVI